MENKIQELADKIFQEGVVKGNEEAQRIIVKANEEADQIIAAANLEAQKIKDKARKDATELLENTKSELKLYASQSVNALKSEIATCITKKVVESTVKELVTDKAFFGKFVVTLAEKWTQEEPVVISTADADALKAYFVSNAKHLLDKGVKIEQVNGLKTLFTIAPADGSYKVNFGEDEFEQYFKAFLRPQLVEMLF